LQFIAATAKKLLPARFASTENCQMPEISLEAVFFYKCLLQRDKQRLIQFQPGTTFVTDQMMMVALISVMICDAAISHVSHSYQVKLLQQIKSAVNSGYIYVGIAGMYPPIYILSADMISALSDYLEHHQPLGC
jgi:hypothetical protein